MVKKKHQDKDVSLVSMEPVVTVEENVEDPVVDLADVEVMEDQDDSVDHAEREEKVVVMETVMLIVLTKGDVVVCVMVVETEVVVVSSVAVSVVVDQEAAQGGRDLAEVVDHVVTTFCQIPKLNFYHLIYQTKTKTTTNQMCSCVCVFLLIIIIIVSFPHLSQKTNYNVTNLIRPHPKFH